MIDAFGTLDCISLIAAVALDSDRAARYMCDGLCLDNCRMVSSPRPTFPNRTD